MARALAGAALVLVVVGLAPGAAPAGAADPRLAGTVTAAGTGAPVAGVRVRLYRDGVGYLEHFADTAADGTWSIAGMPAGSYRVVFSDPTLAHVTEWWGDTPSRGASAVVAVPTGAAEDLDVVLAPAAELRGTIAGPGTYDVYLYAGEPAPASATQVLRGRSGSFSFGGLAAGTYRVLVKDPTGVARDLWYPNRLTRAEAFPIPLAAGQVFTSTYRHPPTGTGTVDGLVLDVEGPVADVVVQVHSQTTGTLLRSGRTDAEGGYRITAVPAGPVRLVFRDPSGAHVTTWDGNPDVVGPLGPYVRPGATTTVVQEMVPTSSLAGVVTDGDTPLAGIRVALYLEGSTARIVTTGADGTWSAPKLEPGSYTVGYSDPGKAYVPEYHGDAPRKAEAAPIALEPLDGIDLQAVLARR